MKKLAITITAALLAVAMLGGIASAKDKKKGEGEGKGKTYKPANAKRFHSPYGGLNLTAEQRKKIWAIMKEAGEKINKEVLTAEQREKLEKNREKMKKRMAKRGPFSELDLTEEQQKKVKAIMKEAWTKAKEADSKEAKRKIMKAAHEKVKKEVLTKEQGEKLEKKHAEMKKRMAKRGPLGGLDLTEEQQEKVKAVMKEARAKAKEADSKKAKHKIMRAAFDEIKNDVLTEDQRKKLEERKEKRKGKRGDRREHRRYPRDEEDRED